MSHLQVQLSKYLTITYTGTIERGHIYFFYRPKVQKIEAHSLDDV
ncbi:hypothetical protein MPER_13841 [Moniliophthora perniciosa FA553]|nr:hypothetical protein MPER_13841 [Moniliophthora perniciosa FA553]